MKFVEKQEDDNNHEDGKKENKQMNLEKKKIKLKLRNIINKYHSKEADGKVALFNHLIKNYNNTNINKVDVMDVSKKIDEAVKNDETIIKSIDEKEKMIELNQKNLLVAKNIKKI